MTQEDLLYIDTAAIEAMSAMISTPFWMDKALKHAKDQTITLEQSIAQHAYSIAKAMFEAHSQLAATAIQRIQH